MREEEELDMHSNSNQGGQAFENSLFITFHKLAGTCTDSLGCRMEHFSCWEAFNSDTDTAPQPVQCVYHHDWCAAFSTTDRFSCGNGRRAEAAECHASLAGETSAALHSEPTSRISSPGYTVTIISMEWTCSDKRSKMESYSCFFFSLLFYSTLPEELVESSSLVCGLACLEESQFIVFMWLSGPVPPIINLTLGQRSGGSSCAIQAPHSTWVRIK